MKDIDSQEWLKLNYQLQNNNSNAVLTPWATAKAIDSRKVFCKWVKTPTPENQYGYYWYYTDPSTIPIIRDCGHSKQSTKYPLQGRGQDEKLTEEQKAEVLRRRGSGESVRAIARLMGVSKSTIAKIKEGN